MTNLQPDVVFYVKIGIGILLQCVLNGNIMIRLDKIRLDFHYTTIKVVFGYMAKPSTLINSLGFTCLPLTIHRICVLSA